MVTRIDHLELRQTEFVMPSKVAEGSTRLKKKSTGRVLVVRLLAIVSSCVAAIVPLLLFSSAEAFAGSDDLSQHGPVIQRSMRVVPRKFVLAPSSPTVAINQTQRFGVTDVDGNPVIVRWNISGLGCYGASCGSIDELGIYHPPASVPHPQVVTLEGVVVSDPHYSVLTEIRIAEPARTDQPAVAGARKPEAAPAVPKTSSIARNTSLPVPSAVTAAPEVARSANLRKSDSVPLPSVVAAPPSVRKQEIASRIDLMPLPASVSAAPELATAGSYRGSAPLSPQTVVAPAPGVAPQNASRHSESVAIPAPVSIAPSVVRPDTLRSTEAPPPMVVAAAPQIQRPEISSRVELPGTPAPAESSPLVASAKIGRDLEPLTSAPVAAPAMAAPQPDAKRTDNPVTKASTMGSAASVNIAAPAAAPTSTAPPTLANQIAPAASSQVPSTHSAEPAPYETVVSAAPEPKKHKSPKKHKDEELIELSTASAPVPKAPPTAITKSDAGSSTSAVPAPTSVPSALAPTTPKQDSLQTVELAKAISLLPSATPMSASVSPQAVESQVPQPEVKPMPVAAAPPASASQSAAQVVVNSPAGNETHNALTASGLVALPAPGSIPPRQPVKATAAQLPDRLRATALLAMNQSPTSLSPPPGSYPSAPSSTASPTPSSALGALQVLYQNGQLTIDTRGATLAEVLRAVAQKIGAVIDVPPGSGNEQIVEHAGPGKPNDVLTQLLNGSHFNFIIVNSPNSPQEISEVLLSVERADSEPAAPATPVPAPVMATLAQQAPDAPAMPQPMSPVYDGDLQPPKGDLSPEARGDLMKEMFRKLGDKNQQQYPPQVQPAQPQ